MTTPLRPSQFIRRRGWLPLNLRLWEKSGWELAVEDAYALEKVLLEEGRALPHRNHSNEATICAFRAKIRAFQSANAEGPQATPNPEKSTRRSA